MVGTQSASAPLRNIIDESFDEAAFLWGRWEAELSSLTRSLDEVWSWTEDRLHGALDGVRVAGNGIVDVVRDRLTSEDRHEIAVCSGLLASIPDTQTIDLLTAGLRDAQGAKLQALTRGLELLGSHKALNAAAAVLSAGTPAHRAALSRLKTFHRSAPRDDLAAAFASGAPQWQVEAMRNASLLTLEQLNPWVARGLESEQADVRLAAVEAGLAKGAREAWRRASELAALRKPEAIPYLKMVAMLGGPALHEVVFDALRIPELQIAAVWALGHVGTRRAAEACIAGMRHEHVARAAGEAYCWITGADLTRDRLSAPEPDAEVPAFAEDDLEANLVPAPEALWPLPDAEAVAADWKKRQAGYSPDVRYVAGQPATAQSLVNAVETGAMLRRPDLIFELRAKTKGRYDVEPRAFTARQRQMMSAARQSLAAVEA